MLAHPPPSYRADKLRLAGNASAGGSLDTTTIITDEDGKLGLTFVRDL